MRIDGRGLYFDYLFAYADDFYDLSIENISGDQILYGALGTSLNKKEKSKRLILRNTNGVGTGRFLVNGKRELDEVYLYDVKGPWTLKDAASDKGYIKNI